ncbi:MAG: hypothetical protein COB02_08905 [Candidatus Cloacimonadota bacterium]|nr:MAG: hypothetical protein COB02_08905 [Candidatus Cloacimonadota bacterium]
MLLSIQNEKRVEVKISLLERYINSPKCNIKVLQNFLTKEIQTSNISIWVNCCRRWQLYLEEQEGEENSFEEDLFLEYLNSQKSLYDCKDYITSFVKKITKYHQKVFRYFEQQQNSNSPKNYLIAKKVLDYFEKQKIWTPKVLIEIFNGYSIPYKTFRLATRSQKLTWLKEAINHTCNKKDLFEWGITALCLEIDPFIESKLLKVLPKIYLKYGLEYRKLVDLMKEYLKSEDPRIRSNTLDGLAMFFNVSNLTVKIQEIMLPFIKDEDIRVATTALLQMHSYRPTETIETLENLLVDVRSKSDLKQLQWLLSQDEFQSKDLLELKILIDKKLSVTEEFFSDDGIEWI